MNRKFKIIATALALLTLCVLRAVAAAKLGAGGNAAAFI